ncbi:MAG TPA: polysaccharide deacetylase family protein [Syntrophales bacterium]|nr:polysaccharide deacetylase family protein [Syntrophales bacterium]
MVKIIQCWDDGIVDDLRLADILRRYNALATFCLNPGLYREERTFGWIHGDREVWRLGINELYVVYNGFEVCSHSMTHPYLTEVSSDRLDWEVRVSRDILQDLFKKPVLGFCYPFNLYNERVKASVRAAGYVWARGGRDVENIFPPDDPLESSFSCHFLSPNFWSKFDEARRGSGVFSFWGHSCEIANEGMWKDFEATIKKISSLTETQWSFITDLFMSMPI